MKKFIFCLVVMLLIMSGIEAQTTISLSAKDKGVVFEGIGAVSAGASRRNLIEYSEKERSEVLDFLFKTKFGAGFHHLNPFYIYENPCFTNSTMFAILVYLNIIMMKTFNNEFNTKQ
jgi:hypothetical protein